MYEYGTEIKDENEKKETLIELLSKILIREASLELYVKELSEVLKWYGENSRLARLIHSEGDAGRHALAADGGYLANRTLSYKPFDKSSVGNRVLQELKHYVINNNFLKLKLEAHEREISQLKEVSQQIKNDTIEKCIKVANEHRELEKDAALAGIEDADEYFSGYDTAAWDIATSIRNSV
jgi:hypothetical protein